VKWAIAGVAGRIFGRQNGTVFVAVPLSRRGKQEVLISGTVGRGKLQRAPRPEQPCLHPTGITFNQADANALTIEPPVHAGEAIQTLHGIDFGRRHVLNRQGMMIVSFDHKTQRLALHRDSVPHRLWRQLLGLGP